MIIVKVMGGLGNQLFQYALYRQFQEDGKEAYLDTSWYDITKNVNRKYQLDLFNTKIVKCTDKQKYLLANNDRSIFGVTYHKIFGNKKSHIVELDNGDFSPLISKLQTAYLDGYWQRKEYFINISEVLKKEIVLKENLNEKNEKMFFEINNTNSIGIHIRRGDYLVAADRYGGICTEKYYFSSIEYMEKQVENGHFFVFSDDMIWCKHFLDKKKNVTFVDINSNDDGYLDLILMSKCKNMIMANSSFSWWATWLNDNMNKIIVAPARWNNLYEGKDGIYDDTWIII